MHPFQRTELLVGQSGWARLQSARVMVVGLGGVGSYAVGALVRSGGGHPRCPSRQAVQISYPRDGTIARIAEVGRRRWRKEAGAHRQARAENAMLRYKRTIGEALKARKMTTQATETRFAVSVLNRMTAHGAPVSVAVVR